MRLFRHLVCFLPLFAAPAMNAVAQQYIERQLEFRYVYYAPTGELFDSGWGLEGSVKRWQWDRFGYSFALGLDDYTFSPNPPFLSEFSGSARIDGTTGLIPIQGSLLWAPVRTDSFAVNLELGLRYIVSITSADVVIDFGSVESAQAIDLADSMAAIAKVEMVYDWSPTFSIVLGTGIQQSVVKGQYGVNRSVVGDADLSAGFVHLGVSFEL